MRYNTLGVQVTNVCNLTCGHCITDSSPSARGDLEWTAIEPAVRSAAPHVDGVCVTGGEPLLRRELTLRVIGLTRELGLRASMVTNGYWARDVAHAQEVIGQLHAAGLQKLAVSFDRFHDRLVSASTLEALLTAAAGTGLQVQVQYCGDEDDAAFATARLAADRFGVALTTARVLPFGRGRQLIARRRVEVESVPAEPCGVVVRPVLTPEGELFTCCGPARGADPGSPLRLATGHGDTGAALAAGAVDPVLNVVHNEGPRALWERLSPAARQRVAGQVIDGSMCALCRAVTDDPAAVTELRETLADDRFRLMAVAAVMRGLQAAAEVEPVS